MSYRKFLGYNVIGGFLWAAGIIYAGFYIGQMLHNMGIDIDAILLPVVALVVIVSILSPAVHVLKNKQQRAALWAGTKKQINTLLRKK
jgi:membrane-associated protein